MKPTTVPGFDGASFSVGDRVELHPSTDLWMRGARFGTVTRIHHDARKVRVKVDRIRRGVTAEPSLFRRVV